MKHYFSFFLGTAFFTFFSQAHAELVINGAAFSPSATTVSSPSTYTSNSDFQGCLANIVVIP